MKDWTEAEGWLSGEALRSKQQKEYSMTNDHGILYLVGDVRDGEWMNTMERLPPKYQNRR